MLDQFATEGAGGGPPDSGAGTAIWQLRRACPTCGQPGVLSIAVCPRCLHLIAICGNDGSGFPSLQAIENGDRMHDPATALCPGCLLVPVQTFPPANRQHLLAAGLTLDQCVSDDLDPALVALAVEAARPRRAAVPWYVSLISVVNGLVGIVLLMMSLTLLIWWLFLR
jgi:hypothetical protein